MKGIKKRSIADTSRKAYYEIVAEGIPETERTLVIKLLGSIGPLTSRQLSISAKKERTSMTRSLHELVKMGKAFIHHKDKCPITGRTVSFYSLAISMNVPASSTDKLL